ncbi:RNA polymerase factor sigma-54 [bacterium]|nr:RNA polymerase factor sigma-54 [bacterium]
MEIQQKLQQRLQQRLIMTPQLRQAMHILQLPILELKALMQEELINNPLLQEQLDEEKDKNETEETSQEKNEETKELDSKWDEYLQITKSPKKYTQEERERRNYIESSITKPISLQHHLAQQLKETDLKNLDKEIAETIIANIDDDGYLKADINEIAHILDTNKEKIEKILLIIQGFDPVGVAARNLQECLLLQLRDEKTPAYPDQQKTGRNDALLEKIINEHIDDLANKRYHKITSSLKISDEELRNKIHIIEKLEPKPGRQYASTEFNFIVPDVIVKKVGNDYKIIVNEKELPILKITPSYKKLLQESKKTDKTTKYIKEKLTSAEWLLKNIRHRQDTIYRVTSYIVQRQREFLDKGAGHLKVLTLKDVAEATVLHSSTISRVTSTKYIETPRGIFKLRYFFSGGLAKTSDLLEDETEITASRNVKNLIKTLFEKESHLHPLSDQKMTDFLNKQGYKIARRTVAKYREQLGILPSKMRRTL